MKVLVSDVNVESLKKLKDNSALKIKEYVKLNIEKDPSFKFMSASILIERRKATKRFLENNHVCMACGDVQPMGTYAIAQTAMGHKVNYTCSCGHITVLPQIV